MYLLYLDESGNESDPADMHFVLAGAAVFERVTFFVTGKAAQIQNRHFPESQPIPFHVAEIRAGKGFWRKVPKAKRDEVLSDISRVIEDANQPGLVLFGAAVAKSSRLHGEEAVKMATELVCRNFDMFLNRRHAVNKDKQRGLLIFSEGRYRQRTRIWVNDFRRLGTQWGAIRSLADIPYFANMRESRLLQLADYVAHALYLMYERHDISLIAPILSRFDQTDGWLSGLSHHGAPADCPCPACHSRRVHGFMGPWLDELS